MNFKVYQEKECLYKKSLCDPTLKNMNNYKKYKNKLNHVLHTAKCLYYQKKD